MAYASTRAANQARNQTARIAPGGGCCDTCSCNCVTSGCCPDCVGFGVSRTQLQRVSMSGVPPQKKRKAMYIKKGAWNYGGLGSFTVLTPCNQIPTGDPYRVPGNQCAGVNGALSFDSTGNLVSAGSTGPLPTAADQYSASLISGISNTTLMIAGGALAAFLFLKK